MNPNKFFSSSICKFFGHEFRISKNITDHVKEYKCSRCGEEMTDRAEGLLAKLTPQFRETNKFLAEVHRRRLARKSFSRAS